jgi:hypothetical protein
MHYSAFTSYCYSQILAISPGNDEISVEERHHIALEPLSSDIAGARR